MKSLFKPELIIWGISFLLLACNQVNPPVSIQIQDAYITKADFSTADQLRYQQDYQKAAEAYTAKIADNNLSSLDQLYATNQLVYCKLILHQVEDLEPLLDQASQLIQQNLDVPPALLADHYYNQGRYALINEDREKAIQLAHQANQKYLQIYPRGHLKIAKTQTLLSLIHIRDGNLTDSVHYYALQANDIILNNPSLDPFAWENDYAQAYSSLLYRAHERGEFHCRVALQKINDIDLDNKWLKARIWNLLANLIKKRTDALVGENREELKLRKVKLYEQADSIFKKAIAIAQPFDDIALIEFYTDWIINLNRFGDPKVFFDGVNKLKEDFKNTNYWQPYYHYLLGYYYFVKDTEKQINNAEAFIGESTKMPNKDYRIFAAMYYSLRLSYKRLKDFQKSSYFAEKSLELYNCFQEPIDVNSPSAFAKLDSTNRYCLVVGGFLAEDLLDKFKIDADYKDLKLANEYFDFVERNSFETLVKKDEDAFLSFQREAGWKIFSKAIEAAYAAWTLTDQMKWQSKTFNYMEYLKSFLLYRDMLKKTNDNPAEYSLNDSIRLLQGQVNQTFFEIKKKGDQSKVALYRNNLVNKLNSLEQRRSKRLNKFEETSSNNSINIPVIQSQLSPKQGLVNYYTVGKQLFSIYIDRDTSIFFQFNEEGINLDNVVLDFRQSLEEEVKLDKSTVSRYVTSAYQLYEILIRPFAHRLKDLSQLIVIPDQLLDPLPFEAFLTKEIDDSGFKFKDLPYLLHDVEIVYSPSWKIYLANKDKRQLRFVDNQIGFWTTPDLNSVNGLDIIEKSIQGNFGNKYQIFNQKSGGKKSFSQNHQDFDILHLLLHARSSRIDRYDNQIKFGETTEDLVYGFELYKERINAKLLILASCESASGTPQRGEGTFSLTRSFINAGVPEIIAAQYLIPQTTTGPILSNFYHILAQGHRAPSALRAAKLEYLAKLRKERYAYPRFWAGMVVFN